MSGFGYTYGYLSLIDPISFIIGILLSVALLSLYNKKNTLTIAQMLSTDDIRTKILLAVISLITYVLISAAQFIALSKLLSQYFSDVPPNFVLITSTLIIASYVIYGGFNAITNTDILQFIIILVFLATPIYVFHFNHVYENTISETIPNHSIMPFDIAFILILPIFFVPISQDINTRVKSASTINQAKIGLFFSSIFYFLIIFSCISVGIYIKNQNIQISDPEQVLPYFFKNLLSDYTIFPTIAALSAIWSSLVSYFINSITSFTQDIIPNLNKRKYLLKNKYAITFNGIFIYLIIIIICLFFKSIFSLISIAVVLYSSVLFSALLLNNTKNQFFYILLIFAIFLAMQYFFYDSKYKNIYCFSIGPIISIAIYVTNKIKLI